MAQKTNPIALRRAAGLRRPAGACSARWGYTDLALDLLETTRWSEAWARHLDRAGVQTAMVALPRRGQRMDVVPPMEPPRGMPRRRGQDPMGTGALATAAVAGPCPVDPWRVALTSLADARVQPLVSVSPLARLLAARLASRTPRGGARPLEGTGVPASLRAPLLRGWLAQAGAPGQRVQDSVRRLRHGGRVTGHGLAVDHMHATAAGHWQSASYIAGEVARRLAAGASWVRLSHGYLAPLARHPEVAGLRVRCAGRLAARSRGAARARATTARWGRTALHTLRRAVDYAAAVAPTTRGAVGVKVWVAYHPREG